MLNWYPPKEQQPFGVYSSRVDICKRWPNDKISGAKYLWSQVQWHVLLALVLLASLSCGFHAPTCFLLETHVHPQRIVVSV